MLVVNKMPLAPSRLCLLRGADWAANEGNVFFTTDMKGSYMKKILAYLLVLVSLMTLFCGTASAAYTSMEKEGYAILAVNMDVYNVTTKLTKSERVPVGAWYVEGSCEYSTPDGRSYYPDSAKVLSVNFYPYKGGDSSSMLEQYRSSTSETIENGKRVQLALHYACLVSIRYYNGASKQSSYDQYYDYTYSLNAITTSMNSATTIYFNRYN